MMMPVAETYIELMRNPAHLGAEATVTILENVVTFFICRPIFKIWLKRHDAAKHGHQHCNEGDGKILVLGNWDPITNEFTPCDKAA